MKSWALVILAGLSAAGSAVADLEFAHPRIEYTAKHSETTATLRFDFKVAGDDPVKILDIRTFCGCLSAGTDGDRKEYGPGDTGYVEAVFTLGSFEGTQEKEVAVTTDGERRKEIVLTAAVTIPPLFEISPPQAKWMVGDDRETKKITVKMLGEQPVRITSVVSTRAAMKAEVREVAAGREYEILLTPDSTESPLLGMVRLETDSEFQRYKRRLVFFNIARSKTVPAQAAAPTTGAAAPATAVTPPVALPPPAANP